MTEVSLGSGIERARKAWGWFLVLGIVMILAGLFALTFPVMVTELTVFVLGCILLATGVMHAISVFSVRSWGGVFLLLIAAVLEIIVGFFLIAYTGPAAIELTLLIGAFFLVGGVFRIIGSAVLRYPNWGWAFVDGLITAALGILIWRGWPYSGLWFIGICVGIDLLFRGWSWVMFSLAVRRMVPPPTTPGPFPASS